MNLLLDTHVFLWLRFQPNKLSKQVLDAYQNPENAIFLSLVSIWEMQIKQQLGKLELTTELANIIEEQCKNNGLQILPITITHIFNLNPLPLYHRDPFDRLLISQANTEQMRLVSSDSYFTLYEVNILW